MRERIKNTLLVSAITLLSRVLGLARDTLTFAFLGLSAVNSAFLFAFTIPNLFRRLLGEGALTSAFVPIFSGVLQREGRPAAYRFLNQLLFYLSFMLLFLVALGVVCFFMLWRVDGLEYRWHFGALLSMLVIPYMFLVCIAAILGAALNTIGRFAAHAFSSVWLNLAIIAALVLIAYPWAKNAEGIAYCLCAGILAGGVVQVMIPGVILFKEGWRPALDLHYGHHVSELLSLFLPGVVGAAVK